jgi:hypothetical protein
VPSLVAQALSQCFTHKGLALNNIIGKQFVILKYTVSIVIFIVSFLLDMIENRMLR